MDQNPVKDDQLEQLRQPIAYEHIPNEQNTGFRRNGITWLASWPKSGNTWVRLFLGAYLHGPENFDLKGGHLLGDTSVYHYQLVSPMPINQLNMDEVLRLRDAALYAQVVTSLKTNLLLKTHNANAAYNQRLLIPSDLSHKGVYIVRDPRDVALSYARYMGVAGIDEAVRQLLDDTTYIKGAEGSISIPSFIGSWGSHVESWLNEQDFPVIVVKYERLMEDPGGTFEALLEFLGIEVQPDRFFEALEVTRLDSLKAREKKEGYTGNPSDEAFFHKGGSRWRDELPLHHAEAIWSAFGETMTKLGYTRG